MPENKNRINLDELIEKSSGASPTPLKIDVREPVMNRIEAYERRHAKLWNMLQWVLALFTTAASLISIVIFESFFTRYRLFFQVRHLNSLTLKYGFQAAFIIILVTTLILMATKLRSKETSSPFCLAALGL